MKTKEELNAIRNEVESVGRMLAALTDEELQQVAGGTASHPDLPRKNDDEKYVMSFSQPENDTIYNFHIYTKNTSTLR